MDGSHSAPSVEVRRRRFTAADVQRMLEIGVLKHDEKVELVWGELVEMSPQGPLHWKLTFRVVAWMIRNLPPELIAASDGPFRLGEDQEPEPELFVFPSALDVNDVRGSDAKLVVEVSHSSLEYDLKVKGPIYASYRVPEYWVIDVENRRTLLHRLRSDATYGDPEAISFDAPLTVPGGAQLVIADLAPGV